MPAWRRVVSGGTNVSLLVLLSTCLVIFAFSGGIQGMGGEALHRPKRQASLVRQIKHPWEKVHAAWEGGEQDPNFIKEEKSVVWSGTTATITKTIYTRSPFPKVMRFIIHELGQDMLVFGEEQVIDMKKREASYLSVNKNLKSIGSAYRAASMRQDPSNPEWTLFEQEGGIELSSSYPDAVKGSVEKFARSAFLSICRSAADALEKQLDMAAQEVAVQGDNEDEEKVAMPALRHDDDGLKVEPSTNACDIFQRTNSAYIYLDEVDEEEEEAASLECQGLPQAPAAPPSPSSPTRTELGNTRGIIGLVLWLLEHPRLVLGLLASQLAVSRHAGLVHPSDDVPPDAKQHVAHTPLHHHHYHHIGKDQGQRMPAAPRPGKPLGRILGAAAAFVSP